MKYSHSKDSVFLNPKIQFAGIVLFGIFLLFAKLDKGELASLDDCYYAQKAKEILITGDWLTMHYAGKPDFDNVPLYIWLEAVMFKLFGVHEYTARFFSAFFGLGTIIMTFYLGKMWFSHRVGVYSAIVMLTTQFFLKYSRRAMFDVTLTFFVTMGLFCFWKSFEKKYYTIFYGLCVSAAILTKSVLGVFLILICAAYLIFSGQWKRLFSVQFIGGSLIGLSIASSWFIYETHLYGNAFLNQHFGWLIWERAFDTSPEKQHWYSYLWYLWKLVEHYLPWVFFAAFGIYRMAKRNFKQIVKPEVMILCWIFVFIIIMSIANEKKVWYIMSVFPALALVSGSVLDTLLKSDAWRLRFLRFSTGFLLLTVFIFVATPVRLDTNRHPELKAIAQFAKENTKETNLALNYKMPLWSNRPVFLFYGDIDLSEPYQDVQSLKKALNETEYIPLLTEDQYYPEITSEPGLDVVLLMRLGRYRYCKVRLDSN